jgi:hypothetical protein
MVIRRRDLRAMAEPHFVQVVVVGAVSALQVGQRIQLPRHLAGFFPRSSSSRG